MRPMRYNALTAADASADKTSGAINAAQLLAVSAQVIVTGSSTGALKFQASNDAPGVADSAGVPTVTNWTDIAGQTVTCGSASTFLIPKFDVSYQWLRVVWTKNNGSAGSVTVQVKSIGF